MESKKLMFYSTNHASPKVDFKTALMTGQAPDKGLYLPEKYFQLTEKQLNDFSKLELNEIAFIVMKPFLVGLMKDSELKEICKSALNFPGPLEKVKENCYVMRLDQGPTASFKDFAARTMARLMNYFLSKDKKKMTILVATSGDTGSAVANAFHKLNNIKVIVLFPENEVSEMQRKQMTTLGENIQVIAVKGKFDDCQALVKKAFADSDLKKLCLNSANSINFGRLLPQSTYYFYAFSRLKTKSNEIVFSVPSGNFGNLCGGLLATKLGLPVNKFIVGVNENNEFPLFLKIKNYSKIEPSINCISNAMNVGHPSNLPRLIEFFNGQMNEQGILIKKPDFDLLAKTLFATSISDSLTRKSLANAFSKFNVILEPHGAVAFAAFQEFENKLNKNNVVVCLETANPAKFPDEIKKLLNVTPKLPASLIGLSSKKESFDKMKNNYSDFKAFLLTNVK